MKIKIIVIAVLVLTMALTELFYFRFHTYFQSKEVNETPPVIDGNLNVTIQGQFVEIDAVHKGFGVAKIMEEGGKRYLRFENFKVTNGPDLYVYLSESKTPGNNLKSLDKYISLGLLKGNIGNQNYEIPEPFRGYDTVVI